MLKLRIVYILSLVIVGVLAVLVFFLPMSGGAQEYSEVQREGLLQTENGWILQFDIVNHEGENRSYTIDVSIDGTPSTLSVFIPEGKAFTYVKQVNQDMVTHGVVNFAIHKEDDDTYLKKATYYLK